MTYASRVDHVVIAASIHFPPVLRIKAALGVLPPDALRAETMRLAEWIAGLNYCADIVRRSKWATSKQKGEVARMAPRRQTTPEEIAYVLRSPNAEFAQAVRNMPVRPFAAHFRAASPKPSHTDWVVAHAGFLEAFDPDADRLATIAETTSAMIVGLVQ